MRLRLLCLLILPAYAGFSQTIPAKPAPGEATICLSTAQATKVRDSLRVLPVVRREARSSAAAARQFQAAADTARAAYLRQVSATGNVRLALREQKIETVRQEMNAKAWKGKAQRRGLLNWAAAALVAAITYGLVIH